MSVTTFSEEFHLAMPIERAWSLMADTQHINQLFFGLTALRVVRRDAEKAHVRGGFSAFAPEYDEYPWAFEAPYRYASTRVFTRGVLKRLETECELSRASSSTLVRYGLKLETMAGPIGALAGAVFLRRLRRGLALARAYFAGLEPSASPSWPPANPHRDAVWARATACVAELVLRDDQRAILERLLTHVAEATEPDVARIRPFERADAWGTPRATTLTTFLMATRAGLLRLSWDLLCPACEAPTAVERLKDLPAGGHCPACDIDFTTNFAENVEATFAPEPAIRRAERLVFCHGSPSTTKSWICQVQVPSNGERALTVHLGVGRYRLQASGVAKPVFLDVKEVGGRSTTLALDDVAGAEGSDAVLTCAEASVAAGAVDVHLVNQSGLPRRFQIAHRAFASQAATAADVTSIGLFRELFGSEVLAPDQHILVGRRSILFTDLVGSTAMYERLGDVSAYAVVRAHFALLFDTIAAHNGSVVKTVGDCVMASFDLPIDAARAGIACIRALATLRTNTGEAPMLRLKVGVHHGPCLAVEANGLTDYFGRTVNIAARVESLARPDELVLSWAVLDDVDVKAWLETLAADALATSTDRKAVKGIDGEVSIARVFADASQAAEVAR